MTLKDIAKLANVSVSTVSRVINKNDTQAASQETRDKIWKLVRESNYVPNTSAQRLKSLSKNDKSSGMRSIVCIFARTPEGLSDPFFSAIFQSIEFEALKRGCTVTGAVSAFELNKGGKTEEFLFSNPDGIIVLGRYSKSLLSFLRTRCRNIIYTGLNEIHDDFDQIICNGYSAAKAAVRRLHSLGHTDIGYIGEMSNEARYRGYYDSLMELKIPFRRDFVIDTAQSMKGGYDSGLKMLKTAPHPPTAIFCANDITAIGAIKAFSESNINVPEDISVISIDNVEMCQFVSPMLTSVDIPKEDLGKFAVKTLIDRMEGGHHTPIKIEVPFKLIQRESCSHPKKKNTANIKSE